MPHNPILSKETLGRLASGYKIPQNAVGIFYRGQQVQILPAGKSVGWGERLTAKDALLYTIDLSPQSLTWRVALPAKGDRDYFSTTINLRYKIKKEKAEWMVNENITDTEQLLIHTLEPRLRKISRQYSLDDHDKADRDLEAGISESSLGDCGLELIGQPDLVIYLSEADHRRIRELQGEKRTLRAARVAEHQEEVPSKEGAFRFRVKVSVTYQVKDFAEMPSESLEESELQLWPKMRRALRRKSQEFTLTQIAQADKAMQDTLDDLLEVGQLDGFGLKVLNTQVATDLDQAMVQQYVEKAQQEHHAAMEEARLKGIKYGTEFYTGLIQKGSLAAAAVAVSLGEISVDELYNRINSQEREHLKLQLDLLQTLRGENIKDELQDYEISQTLVQNIARTAIGSPTHPQGLALPEGEGTAPKLPDTSGESPESNLEIPGEGT